MKRLLFLFIFSIIISSAIAMDEKDAPFTVDKLGIHLMWINKSSCEGGLVFPARIKEEVIGSVSDWRKKNPEADTTISFWYDGKTVAKGAVDNTSKLLNPEGKGLKKVALRDIWTLPRVKKKESSFSLGTAKEPPHHVSFKIDLLRFILAEHCLEAGECDTFLFSEAWIAGEGRKALFDKQTEKLLTEYGFVMLRNDQGEGSDRYGGFHGCENTFMMVRKHESFLRAVKQVLIEPALLIRSSIFGEAGEHKKAHIEDGHSEAYSEKVRVDRIKTLCGLVKESLYDCIPWVLVYELHLLKKVQVVPKDWVKENYPDFDVGKFDPEFAFHFDFDNLLWMQDVFKIMDAKGEGGLALSSLRELTRLYYVEAAGLFGFLSKPRTKYNKTHIPKRVKDWPHDLPIPTKRMTGPKLRTV